MQGQCEPGFEAVREALESNLIDDVGGCAAVTLNGDLVADLWGGHRDLAGTLPWERDTIVNVWSTTKMMTAMCVLMLVDEGKVDLDAPMADYWPEFSANGKDAVLVRHALAHTAGLPSFDEFVDDVVIFDWHACAERLAGQAPQWAPGDGSGYHAETQGWLLGELVRRVSGITVGSFFREHVAEPLNIDFHIGLDDVHVDRVAEISTLRTPALAEHSKRSAALVNTASWRRMEMPASNGHGNARSIALAMAPLANEGRAVGSDGEPRQLLRPATIERIFEVQAHGIDRVLQRETKFGIGYGLPCEATPLGTNDRTFWWAGWGGSMCVVDVENHMTVSYAMNQMRGDDDLRAAQIVFAAHGCI